jgi:hypothetical protein
VDDPERDIHLLVGHGFERSSGSRKAGTLTLTDSDEALIFEAVLTPKMQRTSRVQDFMNAFAAALFVGISPGFRVPQSRRLSGLRKRSRKILELDGAGWLGSKDLVVPHNITLLLPLYSPELSPVENKGHFLRQNRPANCVFRTYDAIVDGPPA